MKKFSLIIISSFILINNFFFSNLQSEIINSIIVKVGESLVTSVDIQNEIITNLVINKQDITQKSVNDNKSYAVKNLINKSIKISEINKYEIKNYNKKDLQNYIENIAKNFDTNTNGLKEIFKQSNINYEMFVDRYKVELLWNTLIFQLYRNQININIVDVDNEIENIKDKKSEEEMEKIREVILNQKKEEKLNLFSRSHFSNIENSIDISFQ